MQIFTPTRIRFATGQLNLGTAAVSCSLLGAGYVVDIENDGMADRLLDVLATTVVPNTYVDDAGWLQGDTPVFLDLFLPKDASQVVLWIQLGGLETSPLLVHEPLTPPFAAVGHADTYILTWDALAGGIFRV